jgi:AraC-like DNA-binding protein
MRRVVLSTDNVPESQRFSFWREAVGEGLFGFAAEPNKHQETPFSANIVGSIGASFTRFRCRSDGFLLTRHPRAIARLGWNSQIRLYRERSAGVRLDSGGGELVTKPGDLIIGDTTVPFVSETLSAYDNELWLFPRKLFDRHLPVSRTPRSLLLPRSGALSRMLEAYLDAFAGQLDALDEREADLVADNFCRLLAMACGASAGEHDEAIRQAGLAEAQRYIQLHLADPHLTPEKAAGALKMSVRQLHLMFEPSGTSFTQYLVRRRLEECRAAFANPVSDRSVADIAFAWGFNSLSTFHRNFRQTFGATPGDVRGGKGAAFLSKRALADES